MAPIWNETDLFRKILGRAFPAPGYTQAQYRGLLRDVLQQVSSGTVSCLFEPEGVLMHTTVDEGRFEHMLHYPIRPHHFHTTVNCLEAKAHLVLVED